MQTNHRYPGPDSFQDDAVDSRIFFGREAEVTEVLNRLLSNKLLVLFAKSGLGKTSLLQAGLFPRLRALDFLPIRLRFNHRGTNVLDELRVAVDKTCKDQNIAYSEGLGDSYWEFFNTALFSKGDRFLTPVLILDQFEEVFTLQDEKYRMQLGEQLGFLINGQTPDSVRDRIRAGEKIDYAMSMPNVRLLISLREDSVGALQELAGFIPGILSQRFWLTQLDRARAYLAIVKPAELLSASTNEPERLEFASKPFSYRSECVEAILDHLKDKRGFIEPFQLQLLCRHVELKVIENQVLSAEPIVVDVQSYLGGREGMDGVIKGFYRQSIHSVSGWFNRRRARKLCETGLLNSEGRRESLSLAQIKRNFGLKPEVLDLLVDKKVLRREERLDSYAYELSHDSLALAVADNRRSKLWRWGLLAGFIILVFAGLAFWQRQQKEQVSETASANLEEYKQQVKALVALDGKGNHTIKIPKMLAIPKGSFSMGSQTVYKDEIPVHSVSLAAFSMSAYEVTFEEYDQFAATTDHELPDDNGWGRGRRPVINVSWEDAKAYAQWLSEKTHQHFRLPTEAEWEYAARAGTLTDYYWGQDKAQDFAWFDENSGNKTQAVGQKKPNAFGLYDMSGNVWEWVEDCWHDNYNQAPDNGSVWLEGDCSRRVLRGGSWSHKRATLRSARRSWSLLDRRYDDVGFRLAQD